jgi:sigma-B regulation protein RsbU (phosphoserine phosphatase)
MEDLDDLYENAPCGYLSLGADGVIVKVNQTLRGWLNVTSYDLLGRRLHDILNVPSKIFYETHFAPLLRMQGYFNEVALDLVGTQGQKLSVLANAVERHDADGNLLFTRVTLFQATERRKYERELVEARRAAERAREEVQALNAVLEKRVAEGVAEQVRLQQGLLAEQEMARLREQFVAILGHDLRNPLASLMGGINILAGDVQTEKSRKILTLMRRSTDRMQNLVSDMLDFARLRGGAGMSVKRVSADLRSVLEEVVDEFRSAHSQRVIESLFELPPVVRCDPARIAQLVSNLIGNALSHGTPDAPVSIEARRSSNEVLIAVINTGDPIPEDVQERLFQPFFRAGPSSGKEGLGLGLYIASEIARKHGGRLEVYSAAGTTSFIFSMPLEQAVDADGTEALSHR